MEKFYSLKEAEAFTKIPRATLRRQIQAGKVEGREVLKAQRRVWEVSQSAVDKLLGKTQQHSYEELVIQWEADQRSGYHVGIPIGERAIEANRYGMVKYWQYLGQNPCLDALSPENFRRAVSNVPMDHANKNCHFTQKDQMFKGLCSFYKLLIQNRMKTKAELEELRQWKPKRLYPAKKKSLTPDQLEQLLGKNETWMVGRNDFDRELTRMLILLITQTGLRRTEVIKLKLEDIDLNEGTLWIEDGKGHKQHKIGITPELHVQLQRWIDCYRPITPFPHLLVQENGQFLTKSVIYPRITRVAEAAGLKIDVHGLRRTFATVMENNGMPWSIIKNVLGHSSIKTTESYVMTDEQKTIKWMRNYGPSQSEQPQQSQQQPISPPMPNSTALAYFQMFNDGF